MARLHHRCMLFPAALVTSARACSAPDSPRPLVRAGTRSVFPRTRLRTTSPSMDGTDASWYVARAARPRSSESPLACPPSRGTRFSSRSESRDRHVARTPGPIGLNERPSDSCRACVPDVRGDAGGHLGRAGDARARLHQRDLGRVRRRDVHVRVRAVRRCARCHLAASDPRSHCPGLSPCTHH